MSEISSLAILEGLYKSKLQNSVQLQTVLALYDQDVARNSGTPNYQQLKTAVKLHTDQIMKNRNFRIRDDLVEVEQSQRVKKERKPPWRAKCKSAFSGRHKDNVPKETHVVSVMTCSPVETRAKIRDAKGDRLLPHPMQRQNKLTARNKNPHRDQAINRKTRKIRVKFHVDSNSVKKKSCGFWHPPVCLDY